MHATSRMAPFSCRRCGAGAAKQDVSDKTQMLSVYGKKRLHAGVRCTACKHERWSRHPEALRRSREADALARAGTSGK